MPRSVPRIPTRAETLVAIEARDHVTRCTTCSKPLLGELGDATGRCVSCTVRNARAVACSCGFLYEGEACTCTGVCRSEVHEALKLDEAAWSALAYRGHQDAYDDEGTILEVRNCSCGSTIHRPIAQEAA